MNFAGMNYLAILLAGAAGFATGALWYGLLGKAWLSALGKTKKEMGTSKTPFIIAAVANLFIAYIMAGLIGHLGEGQVTFKNGIISGAFVWAGFILTTFSVNYAFQSQNMKLAMIDIGHWLAVFLVVGAIIGLMGA